MSSNDSVLGFTNSFIQSMQHGMLEQIENVVKRHGNGVNVSDVKANSETDASKVELPKPGRSSIAKMLEVLAKLKEIVDDAKEATKDELEQKRAEFKRLMDERILENNRAQEKRIEQFKEAQAQKEKAEKGGVLGKVFGFISAAASIIGGAFLCVANPAAGMLMIAGGCCEIAAQVCAMCGKHEAAEILSYVAMGLVGAGLLCMGVPVVLTAMGKAAASVSSKMATQVGSTVAKETSKSTLKMAAEATKKCLDKAVAAFTKKAAPELLEQGAKQSDTLLMKWAGRMNLFTSVLASSASIYRGAVMIDLGVNQLRMNELEYELQQLEANLAQYQAMLNKIEAMMERLLEFMNSQVESLTSATKIVSDTLKDQVDASQAVLAGGVAAAV